MAGKKANYKTVKCVVPQGSILGPLLFLLHINDLQFASDILDTILFADNTNLFYSNKVVNTAFLKVNNKLQKIYEWFISNEVSLNVKKKKKNSFFHKPWWYPLLLPKLNKTNREIDRTESINFLGVLPDKNWSWQTYNKHRK